jgi:hypothetical protein
MFIRTFGAIEDLLEPRGILTPLTLPGGSCEDQPARLRYGRNSAALGALTAFATGFVLISSLAGARGCAMIVRTNIFVCAKKRESLARMVQ